MGFIIYLYKILVQVEMCSTLGHYECVEICRAFQWRSVFLLTPYEYDPHNGLRGD